jgi:SM-20-related protein
VPADEGAERAAWRFGLNRALDADALRITFERDRRVQIADLMDAELAVALYSELRQRQDWRQVINSGDKVFDLDRNSRAAMSPQQLQALDDAVFAGAREGFQHRYEAIRIPDEESARAASSDLLADFASWLSSGEVRDFLRHVTGFSEIDFADAQATAYGPGDFLTAHDDEVMGKKRLAAYVFNLTPQWRLEWGGLLLFHDAEGDVRAGLSPRFNVLNIFAVPQLHSVSMVTRAAPHRRYSITGWLRSR